MNKEQREEFFEIIEEMVGISQELCLAFDDNDNDIKKWKIKLQFAMIRDLVWQGEALIKGETDSNDF